MNPFKKKNYFWIGILFLIEALLFVTNYQKGMWLIGWDNLLPELNFSVNIKRSFYAVWQEYRGLGLLDGMAHAANLSYYLFLYLISFFLPRNFLRWFFVFLMHFLGGVGIYLLLIKVLITSDGGRLNPELAEGGSHDSSEVEIVSFLGALFYLFNLAIIQMFYTPLEAFVFHFAALPWLSLFLIKYLKNKSQKNLLYFFLTSLFFTSQAFVPTLFIVYLFSVVSILFFYLPIYQNHWQKKLFTVLLLIFCVNAFWGLPFAYSTLKNSRVIAQSKINQMSTDELFLRNQVYGNFFNTVLLRGFSLSITDYYGQEVDYLMKGWREHINQPLVVAISFLFFGLAIFGLIQAILKKKKHLYPFVVLFILSFIMLGNDIPGLSLIYQALQKIIPFFHQVFRITFTKFATLYGFSMAVLLSYGVNNLLALVSRFSKKLPLLLITPFCLSILVYSFPSFHGQFIYENLKVNLPQEYFDLFQFLQNQDKNSRIATFPQPHLWGWTFYKWGFRGSGFLWFGIEQPTLDRAFDPWSQENEGYYWELSQAIYSQNLQIFEQVLKKYQVNWLFLDRTIFIPQPGKEVDIEFLETALNQSAIISPVASFGKLSVYQVNLPIQEKDFVFLVDYPLQVEPSYQWSFLDQAFLDYGIYYSQPDHSTIQPSSHSAIYYPFRTLFTSNNVPQKNWQVEVRENDIFFKTPIPQELVKSPNTLNLNSLPQKEEALLYRASPETYEITPQINFSDQELIAQIPKHNLVKREEVDFTQKIGQKESCDQIEKGEYDLQILEEESKQFLRLSSQNTSSCTSFNYPYLNHRYAYLLEIQSRHLQGKDVLFYVLDETNQKSALEIFLPKEKDWQTSYYILPPRNPYGLGYSLHFDNVSFGSQKSVNDLGNIQIYPIPYNFLKSLKFSSIPVIQSEAKNPLVIQEGDPSASGLRMTSEVSDFQVIKKNPSYYEIELNNEVREKLIVLSQAFSPGWKLFGADNAQHVLVNNWANGWLLPSSKFKVQSSKLRIIYLPQYLEYLGFALLAIFSLYLILHRSPQASQPNHN